MDIMDSVTLQDICTVEPCPGERGHGGRGGRGRPARCPTRARVGCGSIHVRSGPAVTKSGMNSCNKNLDDDNYLLSSYLKGNLQIGTICGGFIIFINLW